MNEGRRLMQLFEMQTLRERKCQSEVGVALREERDMAQQVSRLIEAHERAVDHCDTAMRADRLCPDRMLLAAGFLAAAQVTLEEGQRAHEDARDHAIEKRRQWQEARHRTDNMSTQARRACRKDDRRRDDARQAERLSLRAALSGGTKP